MRVFWIASMDDGVVDAVKTGNSRLKIAHEIRLWQHPQPSILEVPLSSNPIGQENLRAEYGAVSNYHSALVQVRFAGAGLYFAGLSLFAIQLEQKTVGFVRVCSAIVIVLTTLLFFLDQRTLKLLEFALNRGIEIEGALPVTGATARFFGEMNKQTGFSHTWILRLVYLTGIGASLAAILFAERITRAGS